MSASQTSWRALSVAALGAFFVTRQARIQRYVLDLVSPHVPEKSFYASFITLSAIWFLRNIWLVVAALRLRGRQYGRIGALLVPGALLAWISRWRAPELRFVRGSIAERLLLECPTLRRVFVPFPVWSYGWWGGFFHSAIASQIREGRWLHRSRFNYAKARFDEEQSLVLPDGGTLLFEWFHPSKEGRGDEDDTELPICVIFPGNVGGSGQFGGDPRNAPGYCAGLIRLLTTTDSAPAQRMRCVLYVRRGCGRNLLTTPQTQSYHGVDDSVHALNFVRRCYPNACKLFGVGYSLGGHILTNYVGAVSEDSVLDGAVCLSNPFNPLATSYYLQHGCPSADLYLRTNMVKTVLLPNKALIEAKTDVDVDKIVTAHNRSFRQAYSSANLRLQPTKEKDLDSMLYRVAAMHVMGDIRTPTLFASCEDDPVVETSQVQEVACHFGDAKKAMMMSGPASNLKSTKSSSSSEDGGDNSEEAGTGSGGTTASRRRQHTKTKKLERRASLDFADGSQLFLDARESWLPQPKVKANPNIALASCLTGGHHAFVGPATWRPSYADKFVVEWLRACRTKFGRRLPARNKK